MDNIAKILAKNIVDLRTQRGWSQEFLAERTDLSRGTIAQYERCMRWPEVESVVKLAKALGVRQSRLFEDNSAPFPTIREALDRLAHEFGLEVRKPRRKRKSN